MLSGHQGTINGLAFSSDGTTIATASADGTARLWDLATGRERTVLSGHQGAAQAVAFWPNGRTVCSAGVDGTIRLWDVATGNEKTTLGGHKGPVWTVALSTDASLLASAGRDQRILLRPPVSPTLGFALAEKIKQRGNEAGPAPSSPPLPEAELSIQPVEASAGSNLTFAVRVRNKGRGPLYRLQAKTKSGDAPSLLMVNMKSPAAILFVI